MRVINLRLLMTALIGMLLAACTAEPLLEQSVGAQLDVVSVTVDVSKLEAVTGRQDIMVSNEQAQSDISAALNSHLKARSSGARATAVNLDVTQVDLASASRGAFGIVSSISGILSATDVDTGDVILVPTEVKGAPGFGFKPGGVIGVVTTKSGANDYKDTVNSLAIDVGNSLFGPAQNTN